MGKQALHGITATPFVVGGIGIFLVKAHAFEGALRAWNQMMYPEALRFIPERDRGRPLFIYSYDPKTHVVGYTTRLGIFQDTESFFGLDNAFGLWEKYANGQMTKEEVARQAASALAGKLTSFGPYQTAVEMMMGQRLFPDPLHPVPIRDRTEYLADAVSPLLGNYYRGYHHRPMRPGKNASWFGGREVDLDEAAFDDMRSYGREFMKTKGKEVPGGDYTEKANAIYWHKQALRWGDLTAADYNLERYIIAGGDDKGRAASLKTLDPLAGMAIGDDLQRDFLKALRPVDQERLRRAYIFLDGLVRTGTTQPAGALPSAAMPLDTWVTTMRDRIAAEVAFQEPIYEMARKKPALQKILDARELAPR